MKILSIIIIGNDAKLIKISHDSIISQTFKDFEIIASTFLSSGINKAIKKSSGKIVKFLLQGDYFYRSDSLEDIINNFDIEKDKWLVTACEHSKDGVNLYWPQYPRYNDEIHVTQNTIGTLSTLTIRNESALFLDKNLLMMADAEYYKRYYLKYGKPKVINKINIVNVTTGTKVEGANKDSSGKEYRYILKKYKERELLKKYDERIVSKLELKNVTLISGSKKALQISMDGINFGATILSSKEQPIINTDFVLIVSDDGYILRPYKWDNIFFEYDHIGDGTFSLKSKNFFIGGIKNIKIAPLDIQEKFSLTKDSFGFSKNRKLIPKFFMLKKRLKRFLKK